MPLLQDGWFNGKERKRPQEDIKRIQKAEVQGTSAE